MLLAVKLFPWSLLWLNPVYFAVRLVAGAAWRGGAGTGDTAHFPGHRRQVAMAAARWSRAISPALRLVPRMLRKRAEIARHPRLAPGEVRRLILEHRLGTEETWHERVPAVCGGAQTTRRCFAGRTGCITPPREEFAVVRCAQCGLLRLDPQPPPDGTAAVLSGQLLVRAGRERGRAGWRRRIAGWCCAITCSFVARALRESRRARSAARCGLRRRAVSGHDAGARLPRGGAGLFARGRGGRLAPAAGAGDLRGSRSARRFAPEASPAITMFHVVEHLYDPRAYLAAARELLAPDGRLIVQVPNAASLAVPAAGPRVERRGRAAAPVRFPRLATWRSCSSRCGFEVVRRKYFSLRDNPAGLASSLAPGARPDGAARPAAWPESRGTRLVEGPGCTWRWWWRRCRSRRLEAAFRAGSTVMIEARGAMRYYRRWRTACRGFLRGTSCTSKWRSKTRWRLRAPAAARARACSTPARAKDSTRTTSRGSAIAASTWRWATRPGTTAAGRDRRPDARCRFATARSTRPSTS